MRKRLAAVMAVLLGSVSAVAAAQDGQFFVNGNVGQSNYKLSNWGDSRYDNNDVAGSLRFGYAWHSVVDYGVEAGYADLGQMVARGSYSFLDTNGNVSQSSYRYRDSQSARGWLLGGNLKYNFGSAWYVSARGGWFRSKMTYKFNENWDTGSFNGRFSQTNTHEYFGVGGGYNLSKSWSVGVNYDYYHIGSNSAHVNLYSASAEYRF